MYAGNVAATLLAATLPGVPLVWSVHSAAPDLPWHGLRTRAWAAACRRLSAKADAVVYVAQSSLQVHVHAGWPRQSARWVPACVGMGSAQQPPKAFGCAWRWRLGVPADAPLIGMIARLDPCKNHALFLQAAALLANRRAHFVCIGPGCERAPASLHSYLRHGDLTTRVHWVGPQNDIAAWLATLNLVTLPSHSEACPLVLLEAMAARVPVVATDVGDCAALLQRPSAVVPPGNAPRLATAWLTELQTAPHILHAQSVRVQAYYGLPALRTRLLALYDSLLADPTGHGKDRQIHRNHQAA